MHDRVEVTSRIDGIGQAQAGKPVTASTAIAVRLRQSGPAIQLVVKGAENGGAGPNPKLDSLLTKARRCFVQLKTEQSASVLSIAQDPQFTTREVTRLIYLAFLAPDSMQRIAEGSEPVGLAIKHLLDAAPVPLAWDEPTSTLLRALTAESRSPRGALRPFALAMRRGNERFSGPGGTKRRKSHPRL
jgi:hypothetical protein